MEEVDQIVIHTLRQIGCDFEEINSLKEFNTEAAMEGVVRCLNLINSSLELSHHIPPSMSGRYRLGSTLASACKDLGYKGEIGYQTFLYSNETDLRKIFLFLFENLPKETEKSLDEPLNKNALILKETASLLSKYINSPWLPIYCKTNTSSKSFFVKNPLFTTKLVPPVTLFIPLTSDHLKYGNNYKQYCSNILCPISSQTVVGPLLNSSVLEFNTLSYLKQHLSENQEELTSLNKKEVIGHKKLRIGKTINDFLIQALKQRTSSDKCEMLTKSCMNELKGSRFVHSLQLQFTTDKKESTSLLNIESDKLDSEEEKQKKREEEIKELQEKVDSLSEKIEILLKENEKFERMCLNVAELIKKDTVTIDEIKEHYRVKKCTLSLLPDAEVNIEKLQSLIDTSSQRLVSLANQWEQHRVPLIEEYRELREQSSRRVNETQRKLEEIKVLREKIQNLGLEVRQKEETYKHLVSAYEKLTKDMSRSAYTRRILEIVGNIKKQKAEIDKVLLDTRNVQKEINKLSGKLERTFTVTDELIFRDAKKDEAIRRAYKCLAALHENCSHLVQIVEETGSIVREIRELEDQIDQENQKQVAATLERITSDYKQMQQENASLMAQLK